MLPEPLLFDDLFVKIMVLMILMGNLSNIKFNKENTDFQFGKIDHIGDFKFLGKGQISPYYTIIKNIKNILVFIQKVCQMTKNTSRSILND